MANGCKDLDSKQWDDVIEINSIVLSDCRAG